MTNIVENALKTNSQIIDTDADGLSDGCELLNNTNPIVAEGHVELDADADCLFDSTERTSGTNPERKDSDQDLISDANELLVGSDPRFPASISQGVLDGFRQAQIRKGGKFKFE